MTVMPRFKFVVALTGAGVLVVVAATLAQTEGKAKGEGKRPQITLKVSPASGMVPVRISGEWNWGDGTISESSNDCDPYESGKSQIRRRYSVTHPYRQGGHYRISFRLKQKDKIVGAATTVVQLLGGAPF
jgi:hypothetical protein